MRSHKKDYVQAYYYGNFVNRLKNEKHITKWKNLVDKL